MINRYPYEKLRKWTQAIFVEAGLDEASAALAAPQLLLADMMGVGTHGVARLPAYWRQLLQGGLNARPKIVEDWHGNLLVAEADLGLGQLVGPRVIRTALDALCTATSLVPFVIRNAGHLGALGTLLVDAAEAGKIAFISQVTQPVMAPEGSPRPLIGNNPIAFAAPRPNGAPLLFDFAASRVARGKVHMAALRGERLEPGWALDDRGKPTEDPAAALAGSLLPAADHKGLALAMMVEVLAGALTGARPKVSANGAPGGVGAFGFVIDPQAVNGSQYFDIMSEWTDAYVDGAAGYGRLPGERSARMRREAGETGLGLPDSLVAILVSLGREAGVHFPEASVFDE
jgi:LDH2 family malate/lactate/ureidoglycolate dehydrogenase